MAKSLSTTEDGGEEQDILQRLPLGEQIKEYVINAIMSGEFEPGERIVESALARRLGVSQAPVRDALRELVVMGFVEIEPYKGTTVRSFTREDLYEVYTVRAALESLAARLAAQRVTDADLDRLSRVLADMVQAGHDRDSQKMIRLDNEFHEAILKLSANKLLYQLWQRLRLGYWTIITTKMGEFELEDLARRHEELYNALSSRKPRVAAAAMRRHIEALSKPPEGVDLEGGEE